MADEFEIESDIPLPPTLAGRPAKYPWDKMKLGDSFFSPNRNVSTCVSHTNKKSGMKFTVRKSTKGGVEGWRVWRIE